jgi:hypothetical protein
VRRQSCISVSGSYCTPRLGSSTPSRIRITKRGPRHPTQQTPNSTVILHASNYSTEFPSQHSSDNETWQPSGCPTQQSSDPTQYSSRDSPHFGQATMSADAPRLPPLSADAPRLPPPPAGLAGVPIIDEDVELNDLSESQLIDYVRQAKDTYIHYFPEGRAPLVQTDRAMIPLAKNVTDAVFERRFAYTLEVWQLMNLALLQWRHNPETTCRGPLTTLLCSSRLSLSPWHTLCPGDTTILWEFLLCHSLLTQGMNTGSSHIFRILN